MGLRFHFYSLYIRMIRKPTANSSYFLNNYEAHFDNGIHIIKTKVDLVLLSFSSIHNLISYTQPSITDNSSKK